METSGVYFGSLKTFLLSVKLENIRIGTHLNILVTHNLKRIDIFMLGTCYPETMPMSCIVKKLSVLFSEQSAQDRPADQNIFKNDFYLMNVKT